MAEARSEVRLKEKLTCPYQGDINNCDSSCQLLSNPHASGACSAPCVCCLTHTHRLDEKGIMIIIVPILQTITLSRGKEAGRWQSQDVSLWHLSDPCPF